MSKEFGGLVASAVKSQEDARALVEKLFDVARPAPCTANRSPSGIIRSSRPPR